MGHHVKGRSDLHMGNMSLGVRSAVDFPWDPLSTHAQSLCTVPVALISAPSPKSVTRSSTIAPCFQLHRLKPFCEKKKEKKKDKKNHPEPLTLLSFSLSVC